MKVYKCPQCGLNIVKEENQICSVCQKQTINKGGCVPDFVRSQPYAPIVLHKNDCFRVSTNAQLLNTLLGTDYDVWMRSACRLSTNEIIWMVWLDANMRDGWRNYYRDGKIIEEYRGGQPYPAHMAEGFSSDRRLVFEKIKEYNTQHYVFRGVYQVIMHESTLERRILQSVSDTAKL